MSFTDAVLWPFSQCILTATIYQLTAQFVGVTIWCAYATLSEKKTHVNNTFSVMKCIHSWYLESAYRLNVLYQRRLRDWKCVVSVSMSDGCTRRFMTCTGYLESIPGIGLWGPLSNFKYSCMECWHNRMFKDPTFCFSKITFENIWWNWIVRQNT
jgi:hypothetical protein